MYRIKGGGGELESRTRHWSLHHAHWHEQITLYWHNRLSSLFLAVGPIVLCAYDGEIRCDIHIAWTIRWVLGIKDGLQYNVLLQTGTNEPHWSLHHLYSDICGCDCKDKRWTTVLLTDIAWPVKPRNGWWMWLIEWLLKFSSRLMEHTWFGEEFEFSRKLLLLLVREAGYIEMNQIMHICKYNVCMCSAPEAIVINNTFHKGILSSKFN